jgi:hypothetical protein
MNCFFQNTHEPFSDLDIISDKTPKKICFPIVRSEVGVLCTGEEIELSPQP